MKNFIRIAMVATVGVVLTSHSLAATMFFDFGDVAQQAAGNYNQVTSAQLPILNATDSTGAGTGIGLATSGFNELGPNLDGTTTPSGAAAIFDAQATRDNLYGHTTNWTAPSPRPLGVLQFTGLNPSIAYDFTFFGSRMNVTDNRETKYTVNGSNSNFGLLNATNNTSNVAIIAGIVPTLAGTISVNVEKGPANNNGNGFTYLGALRLTSVVPEPASGMLLMLGCLGLVASRRLFQVRCSS